MGPQDWAAVIVAIAGALGLRELLPGLIAHLGGAADREQSRIQRANAERDDAERERDDADRRRRIAYEYASLLRRKLTELGSIPPEWPETQPEETPQ